MGLIDDLSFYNRALTSNEIAVLYAVGDAGMCAPPPGAPVIRVNGEFYGNNSVTFTSASPVTIEMHSTLPDATIFYSLDNSSPTFGTFYAGPFTVTDSALIRAVAFNSNFTQSAESDPLVLNVIAPPLITTQPQGQTVVAGGSAAFNVAAVGPGPLAYQWQFGGGNLPGATNAALVVNNAQGGSAGSYFVIVSNPFGSATSSVAQLLILAQPGFTVLPPGSTNVTPGANVTFCVSASGTPPLRYQWRRNGVSLAGETNECFTINNVQVTDGGSYSVVVANAAGAIESPPVVLNVIVTPTPPGDNFAQATPLFGLTNYVAGVNVSATREPGEPLHAGKPGGHSVWYQWTAPAGGIVTFRTSGSAFDTLLGVYAGASVSNLVTVASDEDRGGFLASLVRFNALEGANYFIAIDGLAGAQGNFVLLWELVPTADVLPVITNQPASQTVALGASATFTVGAGGGGLTYQWLFKGTALAGATGSSFTINSAQPANVGTYSVRVGNGAGQFVESEPAVLEIGPVAGVQTVQKYQDLLASLSPNGFTGGSGKNPAATTTTAGGFIPVVQGTISSQILNNDGATNSVLDCGAIGGAARWLGITPQQSGRMILETIGSDIDTVLAVFTNDTANFLTPIRVLACTTNNALTGRQFVSFEARAGTNYLVAVDGIDGAQGIIYLNLRFGLPPGLVGLPPVAPTRRVVRGGTVTFSVSLSPGVTAPVMQWFHEGAARPGETGASLTLQNVQAADSGDYSIIISNFLGSITSHVAMLVIDPVPMRLAANSFDSGAEGWLVIGDAASPLPVFNLAPGSGGGYLTSFDLHQGATWFWRAPTDYHGNKSAAYGGYLAFDLRQNFSDGQYDNDDVILSGGGLTLVFDTTSNPGTTWTTYQVPLLETAGWRHAVHRAPATQHDLLRALADVTGLFIRGEYSVNEDIGNLDNVALVAPSTPVAAYLSSRRLNASTLALEWPATPGLQLEAAAAPTDATWAGLIPTVSNGLNTVTVPTTNASQFFRLKRPAQ